MTTLSARRHPMRRLAGVPGEGWVMEERVRSPPADVRMEWSRRVRNVESVASFDIADTFALFMETVVSAIASGDHAGQQ